MFTTLAFAPLVALYAAQAAYGIVTPTGPGSSDVFKAGSTCLTTWKGDTDSPSPWKTMDIELMSGDNFNMVHVTTVATNQDGSADGQFSFPCPEVDPFSAIYFFQYSTTAVSNKTWTTRFTIASDSGDTTPPANSKQTNGDPIPWGVGKLVDHPRLFLPLQAQEVL
ncbi:hypothetical protein BDQ17DRAFT_625334 [Cyathus striatus]|nr:hypothetical protein BDQ17DRAFT_625334 [Cyathus striatus]